MLMVNAEPPPPLTLSESGCPKLFQHDNKWFACVVLEERGLPTGAGRRGFVCDLRLQALGFQHRLDRQVTSLRVFGEVLL